MWLAGCDLATMLVHDSTWCELCLTVALIREATSALNKKASSYTANLLNDDDEKSWPNNASTVPRG